MICRKQYQSSVPRLVIKLKHGIRKVRQKGKASRTVKPRVLTIRGDWSEGLNVLSSPSTSLKLSSTTVPPSIVQSCIHHSQSRRGYKGGDVELLGYGKSGVVVYVGPITIVVSFPKGEITMNQLSGYMMVILFTGNKRHPLVLPAGYAAISFFIKELDNKWWHTGGCSDWLDPNLELIIMNIDQCEWTGIELNRYKHTYQLNSDSLSFSSISEPTKNSQSNRKSLPTRTETFPSSFTNPRTMTSTCSANETVSFPTVFV